MTKVHKHVKAPWADSQLRLGIADHQEGVPPSRRHRPRPVARDGHVWAKRGEQVRACEHLDRPLMARGLCRPCYVAWYSANNRPRILQQKREGQQRARERDIAKYQSDNRREWLQRQYGMTIEEYEALRAEQSGQCAICRSPLETGRKVHVDHDHETGRVRGLLCRRCNRAIGLFHDNPELCRDAAAYLIRAAFNWKGENRDTSRHPHPDADTELDARA